jgi:diguanylate cyclase (GGDEF)-like protein
MTVASHVEVIPAERRLLVLEPDAGRHLPWQTQFEPDFAFFAAADQAEALARLAGSGCDVVVASLRAGLRWPLEVLRRSGELQPLAARILVCDGDASVEDVREAVNRARVHRVLLEPATPEQRQSALSCAVREVEQRRENARLLEQFIDEWTAARERELVLTHQVQSLSLQVHKLEEQALRDPLTGLYNELLFREQLERELARSLRHHRQLTLLLLELEGFAAFQERYGREHADLLLKEVASLLVSSAAPDPGHPRRRLSDLPFRLGRAEYALLLPETSMEGGRVVAERLCEEVAAFTANSAVEAAGGGLVLRVGLAGAPGDAQTRSELLRRAERELAASRGSRSQHGGPTHGEIGRFIPGAWR